MTTRLHRIFIYLKHLKECFTYEGKHTRPIKVMARPDDTIGEYLASKQFAIKDGVHIQSKEIKDEIISMRRLPLFMLVFHKHKDIKIIYMAWLLENYFLNYCMPDLGR